MELLAAIGVAAIFIGVAAFLYWMIEVSSSMADMKEKLKKNARDIDELEDKVFFESSRPKPAEPIIRRRK